MPLYLCKNEKILKNWTFASEEAGNGTYNHCLTVTNKRMVATSASPNSISRTEIPIDSVKSINDSYYATEEKTNNPNGSIVLAGILLLIARIILIAVFIGNLAGMIIGPILGLTGLIIVIVGATRSKTVTASAGFSLMVTTAGSEGTPLSVGKSFNSAQTQTQTIQLSNVTINKETVEEILDMLGALVLGKQPLETPAAAKNDNRELLDKETA